MKLFFETCKYNLESLGGTLSAKIKEYASCENGVAYIKHVGHLSTSIDGKIENIFFLPKIFLYKSSVDSNHSNRVPFGKSEYTDSKYIELTKEEVKSLETKENWESGLFYKLPLWIYRSLDKYQKEVKNNKIVSEESVNEIISNKRNNNEQTLLDIVISLVDFFNNNKSLFIFIYKEANSGFNKVNWNKTVTSRYPFVEEENLIYPLVRNSRKGINFEEELMIIFFSTLRYINNVYGLDVNYDSCYTLPTEKEFLHQTNNGTISKRLKRIRNNYYNDKLIFLWNLLYLFHSKITDARAGKMKDEYLLCSKFDRLFERMVDSLASDPLTKEELNQIKEQKDEKTIDHLMKGPSLVDASKTIYYVGDSKYYPDGESPHGSAMYKQFTYVRNIIQTQFDWYYEIMKGSKKDLYLIKYRDDFTDGYDITPNFFIGGKVRPGYSFENHCLTRERIVSNTSKGEEYLMSKQFDNRLFDRDTLFIIQYSLNLFYLLKAYSTKSSSMRDSFKQYLKKQLRTDMLATLNSTFDFYYLTPKNENETLQDLVSRYFYFLCGKIYCIDVSNKRLIIAIEKESTVQYATRDKRETILQIINEKFEKEAFTLQL